MSRNKIKVLLIFSLAAVLIFPFLSSFLKPAFVLILVLVYYLFLFAFLNHQWGLFLLILLRPCLDIFTNDPLFTVSGLTVNFSALVAALTLIFTAAVFLKNFDRLKKIPLVWPIISFLGIALILSFISESPKTSLIEWLRLLSIFSLYSLSYLLISGRRDLVRLINAIIISAFIPAALALYQFFSRQGMSLPLEGIYNRIYGTFAHPNLFAYYLLIPIALALFLFLAGNRKNVLNLFFAAAGLVLIATLALTYTRGAWFAFIIIVLVLGIFRYRLFLAGALLAFFLAFLFIGPINARVNNLLSSSPYNSVNWRISLWEDSFGYFQEKPLTGYGTGMSKEIILKKRGPERGSADPHNDYLKIALENGVPGLIAYFWLILTLLFSLFKTYFSSNSPKEKVLILTVLGIALSFYIMSFADNVLRNTALMWAFWALAGGLTYRKSHISHHTSRITNLVSHEIRDL